ncbi:hypothetical protein ZOSMA_2G01630 [Zostera marina]|uniref:BHLH domain-containing protein n=1 Tax=Zostera marina TaxID=29655 RepID=A0A0K9PB12_ZOSMR|nr:hypothetical protein ZOSMA_2G01630 [Zostera marina]
MNSQMINEINNHGSGGLTYSQLLQAPSMDDISDYLRDLSNETGIVKNDVNNEEIHSMLRLPPITIEVDEEETLIQKRKRTRYASKQKNNVNERKRREKINSRLDQLKQLLLPNNAYNMDRASMLDAAIAEVKHLQYQVQYFQLFFNIQDHLIQQQLRDKEEGAKEPVVAPVCFYQFL